MWSASILVTTTAIIGVRYRKEASDSSASATSQSPCPRRALVPMEFKASADHAGRIEPASPSTCAMTGGGGLAVRARHGNALLEAHQLGQHHGARHHRMRAAFAATTSGLSFLTALEITTASAAPMLAAACPMAITAPSARRRFTTEDSDKSELLTE